MDYEIADNECGVVIAMAGDFYTALAIAEFLAKQGGHYVVHPAAGSRDFVMVPDTVDVYYSDFSGWVRRSRETRYCYRSVLFASKEATDATD